RDDRDHRRRHAPCTVQNAKRAHRADNSTWPPALSAFTGEMDFRYIAIEGPIGVGKSVLAERLAARLDATAVIEDKDNPFLADFYGGRPGSALQAQLFYLLNRHRQQLTLQ